VDAFSNPEGIHWVLADALRIHSCRSCLTRLSELALRTSEIPSVNSPLTAEFVESFWHRLVKDLAGRICQNFYGPSDAWNEAEFRQMESLGTGREPRAFVNLAIERELIMSIGVVRPVTTEIPTRLLRHPLQDLVTAVDDIAVRGELVVGTARATARELANANVGDVLLLDGSLGRNLEVRLKPGGIRIKGAIGHKDGAAALKLTLH
jgi:flagellar motor switch/type III secretory pathway protein FliN